MRFILSAVLAVRTAAAAGPAHAQSFIPGDLLTGAIDLAGDEDQATFQGLEKMKLRLKITLQKGLRVRVAVLNEQGNELKGWNLKGKKNKVFKREVRLATSLEHTVVVTSLDDSIGTYEIKTGRKLPGYAKNKAYLAQDPLPNLTFFDVKVGALEGAVLNVNAVPVNVPLANVDLSLIDPAGATVNTTAFESTSAVALHLVLVPLTQSGVYRARVNGLANPGEQASVFVSITQPPKGDQVLAID